MTEQQQQKVEVYVGGYAYEVIPHEVAERLIAEADAEAFILAAAKAADPKFDGIGAFDLTTGEVVSDYEEAHTTPIDSSTVKIPLHRVRAARWADYEPPEVVNWILYEDEAEAALSHANERAAAENYEPWERVDDVPPEYLDSYLRTVGSYYDERLAECYAYEDHYDPEEIASEAAYYLDLIYESEEE